MLSTSSIRACMHTAAKLVLVPSKRSTFCESGMGSEISKIGRLSRASCVPRLRGHYYSFSVHAFLRLSSLMQLSLTLLHIVFKRCFSSTEASSESISLSKFSRFICTSFNRDFWAKPAESPLIFSCKQVSHSMVRDILCVDVHYMLAIWIRMNRKLLQSSIAKPDSHVEL